MLKDEVIASKQYLSSIGHWPKVPSRANPERWLGGFDEADLEHAIAVLESLVYISSEHATKLFSSLVHSLSADISSGGSSYVDRQDKWRRFLSAALVTFPTGEVPSPTDSGYQFARLARQELNFDEGRILAPEDVIILLANGHRRPVLVVDDFAGSGNQFLETWNREYNQASGQRLSLRDAAEACDATVYYLPLVATQYAASRLATAAPTVSLRAAHLLGSQYSALDPSSIVFPEHLRASAAEFVRRASADAGISPQHTLGFHDLGLVVAFEHSVPDATLPIVWVDTPTWTPLLRRA